MQYSAGLTVNIHHWTVFPSRTGHLRLCNINFMAQFHTLHQHFIHYHVPFNKVVKHSFCQTTLIHCARFLETTQKVRQNTITSSVNYERLLRSHIPSAF